MGGGRLWGFLPRSWVDWVAVADERGLRNLVSEVPSRTSFVHEIFTGDRLNTFSRSAEHVPTRFGLVNLRWNFSYIRTSFDEVKPNKFA